MNETEFCDVQLKALQPLLDNILGSRGIHYDVARGRCIRIRITRDDALALAKSNWWVGIPDRDLALFQLSVNLLSMPDFPAFSDAVERALGRGVYTREYGFNLVGILHELLGVGEAPTLGDIIDMVPTDKQVIVLEFGE